MNSNIDWLIAKVVLSCHILLSCEQRYNYLKLFRFKNEIYDAEGNSELIHEMREKLK